MLMQPAELSASDKLPVGRSPPEEAVAVVVTEAVAAATAEALDLLAAPAAEHTAAEEAEVDS